MRRILILATLMLSLAVPVTASAQSDTTCSGDRTTTTCTYPGGSSTTRCTDTGDRWSCTTHTESTRTRTLPSGRVECLREVRGVCY